MPTIVIQEGIEPNFLDKRDNDIDSILNDVSYKKKVADLVNEAKLILKEEAESETGKEVTRYLDMALAALDYQEEEKVKKKPLEKEEKEDYNFNSKGDNE